MPAIRVLSISLLSFALGACSTNPAPVIDRLPSAKSSPSKSANVNKPSTKAAMGKITGDWRPDTYLVKKGDTLFSIGLEHGYDYKDIAQANDIKAPYTIKIGQTLKFSALKEKPVAAEPKSPHENPDGVTTYPMGNEQASTATNTTPVDQQIVTLTEPKAIREPYSEDAYKKPLPAVKPSNEKSAAITKPIVASTTGNTKTANDTKPETKPDTKPETKPNAESNDSYDWLWPTKGKVVANFNDAGNKGMDIAGSMGQAINATASGKVIYSGSDLRGYGKLVIIKHNATYLSVYAHNSQILVKEGQQVSRGQKIAEMGNTDSNTVKLHFEIRQQGKSVDPSKFLASN